MKTKSPIQSLGKQWTQTPFFNPFAYLMATQWGIPCTNLTSVRFNLYLAYPAYPTGLLEIFNRQLVCIDTDIQENDEFFKWDYSTVVCWAAEQVIIHMFSQVLLNLFRIHVPQKRVS
jgi:hypothetical protein